MFPDRMDPVDWKGNMSFTEAMDEDRGDPFEWNWFENGWNYVKRNVCIDNIIGKRLQIGGCYPYSFCYMLKMCESSLSRFEKKMTRRITIERIRRWNESGKESERIIATLIPDKLQKRNIQKEIN